MDTTGNCHQMVQQRLEAVLNASNDIMAQAHLRVVEEILAQNRNPAEYDETIAMLEEHGVSCTRMKRARELIPASR